MLLSRAHSWCRRLIRFACVKQTLLTLQLPSPQSFSLIGVAWRWPTSCISARQYQTYALRLTAAARPRGPLKSLESARSCRGHRRVQPLLDGRVIVTVDERCDPLCKLLGRLDKRKVANAVQHPQHGVWHVLAKPLHGRTIGITASNDE